MKIMENNNTQLTATINDSAFSLANFEHAQRVAKMIATSTLVPDKYQGRVDNVMIAMEMANRMNISPLMVMQNLHIVKGNPGWSGSFVIAMINGSKRFDDDLEFEFTGEKGKGDYGCRAFQYKKGKRVESTKVDWNMVVGEGWDKNSKWKTMTDQMFMYRSAAFFGRAHTPDLLMGMQTAEEVYDVQSVDVTVKVDKEAERVVAMIKNAKTKADLKALEPHVKQEQLDLFNERMNQLK
jgi:hypothetical protein